MVDRETTAGRALPIMRLEWPAPAVLLVALARFSRQKPLGALGGLIVLALILMAVLAPLIAPYDPRQIIREANNRVPVYAPPGPTYLLGTDHVGRDVLSRIIHGARISLYVGVGAVAIGVTGWFVVGLVTAYAGGVVDLIAQRVVDAMLAVPGLVIVLAIMAVLGSSLNNVILAIVIGMLAPVVRTVRSQVLSVKEMEYVIAARAIGAPSIRIIARHIMPNCFAIYLILATYYLGFAIILEASLSFLGVGVPPDVPSWGGMLTAAAQGHVTRAPWAGIFPGLAIFIAVLGFNLLGDALRDVLEPRLRGVNPTTRLLSRG
ncbi:MAG TPA: ABC transporter permease [Alphaproteobacteria bacterium]|nr:ABC transporter permease [Alphaproteobacteria bacterium]